MVRGKEKSSNTHRKDPAWKYSVQVDVGGENKTYIYLKCNFCDKVVKGGVTRMKEHLSGSHKNVAPCMKVPECVRAELQAYIKKSKMNKELSQQQFDDRVDAGAYYDSEQSVNDSSYLPPHSGRGQRGPMDQSVINVEDKRDEGGRGASQKDAERRRQVYLDIGRFFFENAIPFNVAMSPSYFNMIRSIASYGQGFIPPSMYELRTWILKEELKNTEKSIEEIKRSWPQTGVTIMLSYIKNRSLINILVNNAYGTIFLKSVDVSNRVNDVDYIFNIMDEVVDEIGEKLVVQVVTDNTSTYKTVGAKLMEKRKHLYWTPCAACCMNLILESMCDLPQHKNALIKAKKISKFIYNHSWVLDLMRKFSKNELLRPATTRFATSFLTLQSILDSRQPLEAMFTSSQWWNCTWAKKLEGREVRKIVLSEKFWASVTYAITTTRPLMHVLRMIDGEKNPAMGYLYNAMDEAKKQIAKNLGDEVFDIKEICDIINAKWDLQMHYYLYATGYYLNPQFQYAENKSKNPEIKLGLYHCMDRIIEDPAERSRADMQLVAFCNKEGFFGLQLARDTITRRSPVEWWIQFGDATPDLQRFAIRVLGLTCSSSGFEKNWSTYNKIQIKKRNRLATLRVNSLVYIMFNKRLKDRHAKKKSAEVDEDLLLCPDIPSDDEWFIEEAIQGTTSDLQGEDFAIDVFQGNITNDTSTSSKPPLSKHELIKRGKRKIGKVEAEEEEEDEWEDIESIDEEGGEKAIHFHTDSNEDPLSDGDF